MNFHSQEPHVLLTPQLEGTNFSFDGRCNDRVNYPPDAAGQEVGSSPSSSDSRGSGFPWFSNSRDPSNSVKRNVRQSHFFKSSERARDSGKDSNPPHSSSRSRHSSRSLSALLLLTNERLTAATSRNATLETQQEELLIKFASLAKEKTELEAELRATQESLRLHRVQLDLAQKEINRANEVVRSVDQARAQAETNAAKLKERVRALEAERVLRRGWEEGWDIGFKEGLHTAQAEKGLFNRFTRRRAMSLIRTPSSSREDDASSTESASTQRARPSSRQSRRGSVPDVAPHAPPLPVSTLTTPMPVPIPSTQPQHPRPPSSSRTRERAQSISSRRSHTPAPFQRPTSRSLRQNGASEEHVSAGSSPEDIHPIPVHEVPPSPSMSHCSIIPPPDNYIPTMTPGKNGFIPMPPPHELIVPVPPTAPGPSESRGGDEQVTRGRNAARDRTYSNVSRASTRISEYDLVSSPMDHGARRGGGGGGYFREREQVGGTFPARPERSITPGAQVVEEWRNNSTPTPANEPHPAHRRPTSPYRARSPRVSGGPRERREIVMPTPLQANSVMLSNPSTPTHAQRIEDQVPGSQITTPVPPLYQREQTPIQAPVPEDRPASRLAFRRGPGQGESSAQAGSSRTKTPMAWLKQLRRSFSSPAPKIEVEPPSQTPTDSTTDSTSLNPVLLTPEDANRPIALPNDIVSEATRGVSVLSSSTPVPNNPITIRLPDDELPLGFVQMTPIIPHTPEIHGSPLLAHAAGSGNSAPDAVFSPIPDNFSLPDPFQSPVQRPATAGSTRRSSERGRGNGNGGEETRTRTISFGGFRPWGSPDSARLSRPLSIFSDD